MKARIRSSEQPVAESPPSRFDLWAGLACLAIAAVLFIIAIFEARAEIARSGRNVDSGVYTAAFAVGILLPMALLFLAAAWATWGGQRPQALALRVAAFAWPVVLYLAIGLASRT